MRAAWIVLGAALVSAGGALALTGCGDDAGDARPRVLDALARVPVADAYELRVALREPGGRRRIVKLSVDARETPRPSGTWRATYEVDVAGRDPYVVESSARQDVVAVSVGRGISQPIPREVGRAVTFASRVPRRVLDSPFVLAPYDRATLDPSAWPLALETAQDADRVEGSADAEVLLEDLRGFVAGVVGDDPADRGARAGDAELAITVGPEGRLGTLDASLRIAGGGRASVQLRARETGRGGLETVRARSGAPLRRLPAVMRGAVPPRLRQAFGLGEP